MILKLIKFYLLIVSCLFLLFISLNLLLDFLVNGVFSIRVIFSSKSEMLLSFLIPIPTILGSYFLMKRKSEKMCCSCGGSYSNSSYSS